VAEFTNSNLPLSKVRLSSGCSNRFRTTLYRWRQEKQSCTSRS